MQSNHSPSTCPFALHPSVRRSAPFRPFPQHGTDAALVPAPGLHRQPGQEPGGGEQLCGSFLELFTSVQSLGDYLVAKSGQESGGSDVSRLLQAGSLLDRLRVGSAEDVQLVAQPHS